MTLILNTYVNDVCHCTAQRLYTAFSSESRNLCLDDDHVDCLTFIFRFILCEMAAGKTVQSIAYITSNDKR